MSPKRLAYIVATMVLVATIAMLMLNNMFEEVPKNHKYLILASATAFSGIIAFVLFPKELEDEKDSKNPNKKKKDNKNTAK